MNSRELAATKGMVVFTCHKQVFGKPMTRGAYNLYRGWTIPEGENPDDPGYLVEYPGGGEANHPNHDSYISWSPEDAFVSGYTETYAQDRVAGSKPWEQGV